MTVADGEIVAKVLGGDAGAYALLFRKYGRVVHALALARTTRREAAAEVTRRTFEAAYAGLESLPAGTSFRQVLLATAKEQASAYVRDNGRSMQMLRVGSREAKRLSGALHLPTVMGSLPKPDAALVLLEVLGRLPPTYEVPMLLHHIEGMAVPEIAEVTGQTAAEVRTALDGGRRLFERELRHGLEMAGQA
ncbi:MAG: RNA polymerase sigma factor [Planctomycetaceae bacterium]|nr:RNA polymerase sigma factor [Planctomycetota bacterium]NUN52516.1 RNA polymerase sigma factor [Planctomycetaceae bacterium]